MPPRPWTCLRVPASAKRDLTLFFSNATASALNQTQGYFTVLDEVAKYNVHLNYFERLWAVRSLPSPLCALASSIVPRERALTLSSLGLVPLHAE